MKPKSSIVVLMSLPRPNLAGGPATHLPLLRAGLEKEGIRIIPFNYTRRTDQESKVEKLLSRAVDLMRVVYLILRCRPDLIHHNSAFDHGALVRDGMLCFVARLLRTPIFIKTHGSIRSAFGSIPAFQRAMRYLVVNFSTGLGVLSEAERREFIDRWPKIAHRVHVVKNIVRDEFLQAKVEQQERMMVFFTSRFIREKGMFDLLEAVTAIVEVRPECRFTFIGSGPDAPFFKRRIEELGLQKSVAYLQNRSYLELIEIYQSGGIFVFPSHFPEGMPMSLIEAMAVGLLAISSSGRFVRHVSSFEKNSVLLLNDAEPFPSQIARSVVRVINDPQLRKEVGEMNKIFTRQYSQQIVVQEFLALYKMLAKRSSNLTCVSDLRRN